MTIAKRQYIPRVGDRVRLRTLADCQQITGEYEWPVLIARGVDHTENAVLCERTSTANGEQDGKMVVVPLAKIEPPIGWKPRYTIHAAPDQVAQVLSWLPRGIVVRFSQYIGDGSTAFQPADNSGQPHWKFGEITDTIPADQTRELIRVVKLETKYDAGIPAPCEYCHGTGQHTPNPALTEQTESTAECKHCGVHIGFSFTEPWHFAESTSVYPAHQFCDQTLAAGACWPCKGTGKGTRYLSEMEPRKERKQAIAELERQGWRIWYQKRGQTWMMERETIVKDFGQDADADAGRKAEVQS